MSDEGYDYEVTLPSGDVVPGIEVSDEYGEPIGVHVPSIGVVLDADGTPYDHESGEQLEWAEPEPEPYEHPSFADLRAQHDELEQRVAEQEARPPAYPVLPPDLAADNEEQRLRDWHEGRRDADHSLNYSMTDSQASAIARHSYDTGLPFLQAAEDMVDKGRGVLPDLDGGSDLQRRAARQQQAASWVEELERPRNPDGTLPPSQQAYDLDDRHGDRQQYLRDRVSGADMEGADVFHSSDWNTE